MALNDSASSGMPAVKRSRLRDLRGQVSTPKSLIYFCRKLGRDNLFSELLRYVTNRCYSLTVPALFSNRDRRGAVIAREETVSAADEGERLANSGIYARRS